MQLIGITGKKCSGKDTVADFLVRKYGFTKLSFALPLKTAAQELFLLTPQQLHDRKEKEAIDPRWGVSPRQIMQMIGTDWVRHQFRDDFWVRRIQYEIERLPSHVQKIVVSDVRFENEKQWILDMGGQVIGLSRKHINLSDQHESETAIDACLKNISVFDNDGPVQELYKKIEIWMQTPV